MILQNRKGTTLIELIIVIVIFTIIGGAYFKNRSGITLRQKHQVQLQRAYWFLQSQTELLRAMPFEKIEAADKSTYGDEVKDHMGIETAEANISVKNISNNLKRIDIEVNWHAGRSTQTIYRYKE